jgi:hypothetical protein
LGGVWSHVGDDAVSGARQVSGASSFKARTVLRALHHNQIEIDSDTRTNVSLSDITQFVGTSSVPVVVAGSVLGVFELGEKLASQRAKDALSKWLLTFDVRKAGALPEGTREVFERIFGERHFSLKCFVRSAVFSVGAMVFIILLGLLILPHDFVGLINSLDKPPGDSLPLVFGCCLHYGCHGAFC